MSNKNKNKHKTEDVIPFPSIGVPDTPAEAEAKEKACDEASGTPETEGASEATTEASEKAPEIEFAEPEKKKPEEEEATPVPPEALDRPVEPEPIKYDMPDFANFAAYHGLATKVPVTVTGDNIEEVIDSARRLGKLSAELDRKGAYHRHLAVIAEWWEGDRWLAVYKYLNDTHQLDKWAATYAKAGKRRDEISYCTMVRKAFDSPDFLKKFGSKDEARKLARNIIANRKLGGTSGPVTGTPGSVVVQPTDTGTGTDKPAIRQSGAGRPGGNRSNRGNRNRAPEPPPPPPPPPPATDNKDKETPATVEFVIDGLAVVCRETKDVPNEKPVKLKALQDNLRTIWDYLEQPLRWTNPVWLLEQAAAFITIASDQSPLIEWADPVVQRDVDRILESLDGNVKRLHNLRKDPEPEPIPEPKPEPTSEA